PMFPSNPLERDLSTPTKQSEIGKGDVSTVKRTKSPGHKSRGCSRCKPRMTPRSDSGVNSERDLLRLESGCNTKFHSLPRWRRPMTQFGQHSKPANGKRLQGLEALELPPSDKDLDAIAQRREERHSDDILLAELSKLNALDYGKRRKAAAKKLGITTATLDK